MNWKPERETVKEHMNKFSGNTWISCLLLDVGAFCFLCSPNQKHTLCCSSYVTQDEGNPSLWSEHLFCFLFFSLSCDTFTSPVESSKHSACKMVLPGVTCCCLINTLTLHTYGTFSTSVTALWLVIMSRRCFTVTVKLHTVNIVQVWFYIMSLLLSYWYSRGVCV